jgi:EAL domain-containing protein (putative c-di-GMP-specific phosphodiesterase class I)
VRSLGNDIRLAVDDARTAGCRLIAEGIEAEAEARTLIQLGVEFGQGYWYGRPEPAPGGE